VKDFDFLRPGSVTEAVAAVADHDGAVFIGGGTNLIDLMREGITRPDLLVDTAGLDMTEILTTDSGLVVGAGVRNTALAAHPVLRQRLPFVSEALLSGASGQLRNLATVGGNLLQRTRCLYFYDETSACNKRSRGSGCDAQGGFHRMGAVLGASDSCSAVHASDLCVALVACDAIVHVTGPAGDRTIPLSELHRLPGDTPDIETDLAHGELITAVEIPFLPEGSVSSYRKVRDRASYAFALVSVAAAVRLEGGVISDVRLAFGGVGTKPWRATLAEEVLRGAPPSDAAYNKALDAELAQAVPGAETEFKIGLTRRTAVAQLRKVAERATP
jgi:xanthine dehydrogenase YagS FAD-binding subunit